MNADMSEPKKKPSVAFWATVVVVVVLVAYSLSFGPACWLCQCVDDPRFNDGAEFLYRPFALACDQSVAARSIAFWYDDLWEPARLKRRTGIHFPPGFMLESIRMR